jgi:hypothetical protein
MRILISLGDERDKALERVKELEAERDAAREALDEQKRLNEEIRSFHPADEERREWQEAVNVANGKVETERRKALERAEEICHDESKSLANLPNASGIAIARSETALRCAERIGRERALAGGRPGARSSGNASRTPAGVLLHREVRC